MSSKSVSQRERGRRNQNDKRVGKRLLKSGIGSGRSHLDAGRTRGQPQLDDEVRVYCNARGGKSEPCRSHPGAGADPCKGVASVVNGSRVESGAQMHTCTMRGEGGKKQQSLAGA